MRLIKETNPSTNLKAVKNETELNNTREAMLKDGVAITKFLKWLDDNLEVFLCVILMSVMTIRSEDISRIIPTDLRPTNDGGVVASRIGERGINAWLNSPSMKNTGIVKGAQSLERNMASDVAIGGDEPDSIKHSFKFGVKAEQSKAQLEYAGLMNANVSYQVAASTFNVEVREPVALLQTDLVFNHINTRDDQRDVLSVRWNW